MILGIIYKNGKIINHRSLIKVVFNPIFRFFGYQLVSVVKDHTEIIKIEFVRCKRTKNIKWLAYKNVNYDYIKNKRIFF